MKKIILVEDDQFLQQLYNDLLTQEGYSVKAVDNGNDALKEIEHGVWDLVLLDIMLPGMDGFTIFDKLVKDKKKPKCPIVFMTNLDGSENDKKKLGKADAYWIKSSMAPPDFIENVKKILK